MKKLFIFILFFLIIGQLYSQKFKNRIYKLNRYDLKFDVNASPKPIKDFFFRFQRQIIKKNHADLNLVNKVKNLSIFEKDKVLLNIMEGDYILNSNYNKDSLAFQKYNSALKKSIKINDSTLTCEALKRINDYFLTSGKDTSSYKFYSSLYIQYANNKDNIAKSFFFKLAYNLRRNHLKNDINKTYLLKNDFHKGILLSKTAKNDFYKAEFYQLLGVTFDVKYRNLDSSLIYSNKAEKIYLSKKNISSLNNKLFDININKAFVYHQKKDYKNSISFLKFADTIDIFKKEINGKINLYNLLSLNYKKIKNYQEAYFYLKKRNSLDSLLSSEKISVAINEISTKYQTAEKEKVILIEQQKNKEKQNFIIGSILFIFLGGTIAFLSLKNSKRKQKLAEQQKELETQKNLTLLKEQEITTINAMVDGQEKERKLIAEDLHDNLGSVLATLKLHFENLQINKEKKKINQDELFNKTESLIDEAYLKVRSIAHAKNAGVIANQGLLVAIKMMAEKVSSADKIKIEVIDFGLDTRLENSLEISVFRIIQELVTNVIKHAEAKNTTINISQFDNSLNIIIEDNGKGFNINKVNLKDGMGISSIKTRITHLKGTFTIDSTINKGTSIIINIPIT